MHLDDNPQHIGMPGTPPTVAVPSQSMWQTDSLAIRLIIDVSWCLRAPNSVSWVTNVTW